MIATQYGRVEIAHFLLGQAGIEIDHVNDKGVTTLLIACAGEVALTHLSVNLISRSTKYAHLSVHSLSLLLHRKCIWLTISVNLSASLLLDIRTAILIYISYEYSRIFPQTDTLT